MYTCAYKANIFLWNTQIIVFSKSIPEHGNPLKPESENSTIPKKHCQKNVYSTLEKYPLSVINVCSIDTLLPILNFLQFSVIVK